MGGRRQPRTAYADDRAARRHGAAPSGDRGRGAAGAAARVGARSGDVPEEARPLPDLPVSIVLGGLFAVTAALALGLHSPSPEARGGQGVRTESGTGQGVRTADTLWLENAGMRLGFDPRNGALLAFIDRATAQSFLGTPARRAAAGLWQLDRLRPGDPALDPSSARNFSWRRLAGEWPALALGWEGFGLTEAPRLRVTATVRLLADSALSEWRIVVDSPGAIAVEQ